MIINFSFYNEGRVESTVNIIIFMVIGLIIISISIIQEAIG